MTTRTRTPRRRRMWTADESTITVGTLGVPGQIFRQIDVNFLTQTGWASMLGCTIARTHTCVRIDSNTNTGNNLMRAWMGIGIFPSGMDNGDFPDLSIYNGDWFVYECYTFQMPSAASTLVLPESAAVHRSDYRSMRKVARPDERVCLVWQQDTTVIARYGIQVSMLVLLP